MQTKKGFTLVELIVVITILAILGTIAFLSLQGYSSDARNTKRSSDLASIQSAMSTAITQGASVMSYAKNDNSNDSRVANISVGGSTPSSGTDYEAGHVNYGALGLKTSDFSDPLGSNAYVIGVTTRAGGKYEIASTIEKGAVRVAKVVGDYTPRTTTAIAGSATAGSTLFVIGNTANINKFKIGDTVTGGRTITAISPNGLSLTVNSAFTGSQASIALAVNESTGLIDRNDVPALSGNNIVVDNGTVNFSDVAYAGSSSSSSSGGPCTYATTSTITTFANPQAMVEDSSGNVYVSSSNAAVFTLGKITPSGVFSTWGQNYIAYNLLIDSSDNLYAIGNNGIILKSTAGTGSGTLLYNAGSNSLYGGVIDSSGNIFVMQHSSGPSSTGSLMKITPAGSSSTFVSNLLTYPSLQMAIDENDNVYVGKANGNDIMKITPAASSSVFASFTGSNVYNFAYDSTNQLMYTSSYNGPVMKFDSSGSGTSLAYISQAGGITFDADTGTSYVIDSQNDKVIQITSTGGISDLGATGDYPGQIFMSSTKDLYVSNFSAGTITKFECN